MPRRRSESHRTSRHPRPARPSATPAQDQREQLLTRAARLERHCREAGFAHVEVATDLGRGLNYRKSGLQRILVDIRRVRVSRLVVVTKDLLLRFGSELLFQICRFFGVEVVVSMLLQGFPVSSSSPRRDSHRLFIRASTACPAGGEVQPAYRSLVHEQWLAAGRASAPRGVSTGG